MKNLKEIQKTKTEEASQLESLISENNSEKKFTLKILSELHYKKYNKPLCRSKISKILKYQLNYNYRKTILKNPRLEEDKYKVITFAFLKAICRRIINNFKLVFIDETGFCLNNSNLKIWRKAEQQIIGGPKKMQKKE